MGGVYWAFTTGIIAAHGFGDDGSSVFAFQADSGFGSDGLDL